MKKFASLLLALVMMISCVPAMAATVDNSTTDHSYQAYQVFAGTQTPDTDSIALGDIIWGSGVNGDALLTQLTTDYTYFDSCSTAAQVALVLEGKSDDCAEAKALANAAAKHLTSTSTAIAAGASSVELAAGYWLLVDTTNVGVGDARNTALLQVTKEGDIKISKKYSVPTVDKTIKDEGEAADANIGDTITFVLTATLPNNLDDYDSYKVVFHDTMSKGLTYVDESATVSIGGTATNGFTVSSSVDEETGVTSINISSSDVKKLTTTYQSSIVVEYDATVNSQAVIGSAGNPNEVYLEYSNDPNWTAGSGESGGPGGPDEPGQPGQPDGSKEPTGKTPKDEVIVFVYELDGNKTDKNNAALKDAQFVLLNSDKTKIASFADGRLAGWVAVSGVTVNTDGTYPAANTVTSAEDGKFAIIGLDAGTYYLRETKAPGGYNKLTADIEIKIEATITDTEDKQSLDALKITVTDGDKSETNEGNITTGIVTATIINNAGVELPETGGMGTTILYIGGGVLVLAAIVMLIAKRRTNAD